MPSPTGKGVVIIGGKSGAIRVGAENNSRYIWRYLDTLLELSGDTIESLKWTFLEQKLQYPRHGHVSFPIPNEVLRYFLKKKSEPKRKELKRAFPSCHFCTKRHKNM